MIMKNYKAKMSRLDEIAYENTAWYRLVNSNEGKKQYKCLKCSTPFYGSRSNRICASCNSKNGKFVQREVAYFESDKHNRARE